MDKPATFLERIRGLISLISIGTFLAIVTPIAYLLGLSFYEGKLSAYGVDSDIFPLSTQYVYINSYFALNHILIYCQSIFNSLMNGLNWLSLCIFCLMMIVELKVYRYSTLDTDHRSRKLCTSVLSCFTKKCYSEEAKPIMIVLVTSYLFMFIACVPILLCFCLWLPSRVAYSEGEKMAAKTIKNYRISGCKADSETNLNTCTLIKDEKGRTLYEGLLIAINDKEIAIFDKKGSHILDRKEGLLIERSLH